MAQTLEDKLKKNKLIVDQTKNSDNYYFVQPTPGIVVKFKKVSFKLLRIQDSTLYLWFLGEVTILS